MEKYATENKIPIMEPLGIELLKQMLRVKQPKNILEIGAAIGYSAIRMAEATTDSTIVTVERDESRYQQALANIKETNLSERIDVIFGDALEVYETVKEKGPYDVFFIDAAKGQYQQFFELYEQLIHQDGLIITDNVLFKGYVVDDQEGAQKGRMQKIGQKVRAFNNWILNHPDFVTTIVPVGDGVALTVRK
ncbi:methyltransferase domain-containing protein [Salinibacillus xinjiangensis]|uniref:tRNA 5-hydroxyuridine methyltransferase n=2 Tax=Salinibacillus xinjiangensis TaxID=1229268 RepID=A0A6G1X6T9_9BACI|nr:O-methyltransferase [Salinibacillus xinjiangensis]MRG86684.1 methyltransferase domain-containing protein [Salinibacillus xinjiangensis]